jgi:hypothetical protein
MSRTFLDLQIAALEFANRPLDEEVDRDALRSLVDLLEAELEILPEPLAERAQIRAESEAWVRDALRQLRQKSVKIANR